MPYAQQKMGFSRPPKLFLRQDWQNSADPLGKTGFYDPQNESITLYISDRHPKDIMRSLAHELQHHAQKCNGDFDNVSGMGEQGYAQADPHMRSMEIEAYQASIVFRDWEDSCKGTIYYEHLQKGDKSSMSTKDWKNGELKSLLSEAWGFKMDLSKLNEKKELEELATGRGYDTEAPRKARRVSGEQEEEDCDARTDPTCVPEPGEKAVASSIASRMQKENLDEGHDEDWGMGKDEESRTHHGEEDYTGHKGDESHTHPGEEDYEGEEERPEDLASELLALAHRMGNALGVDSDVSTVDDEEEEVEELDEGEGDRKDEREQGRDAAREHRPSSSGKLSEAQMRKLVRRVLKHELKNKKV